MIRKLIFLALTFYLFIMTNNISAQNIERHSWKTSIYLNPSLLSSKSNWSLSHPIGGGRYETITGTFEQRMALTGGVEMNRGKFGFQFNLEFISQKLNKSEPIRNSKLHLLIGEFSILYYPVKYTIKSLNPYISFGSGFLKANGDIDNTGYIISYAAGIKIPFSAKFGINLGLKSMLLKYTQLNLAENISKDIRIYPFKFIIGGFYQL